MGRLLDYNATILRREELAAGLAIFQVALDSPLETKAELGVPFLPGQYLTIGLNRPDDDPDDTRPVSVLRPMTIASPPEQTSLVEFYVRYISKPESRLPLTHLMWELAEGARMFVRPSATGRFTEKETFGTRGERALVMIAGGTGLAPFMSLIRSRLARDPNVRLDDHVVLHGASNPSFLGYRGELESLSRTRGLRYLPTVRRPHQSATWEGALGRVEHLLAEDRIGATEAQLGVELRPERATVLVCGLGETIAATLRELLRRGFVPENRRIKKLLKAEAGSPSLFYEQYDTEPLFRLNDPDTLADLLEHWRPPENSE